MASLKPRNPSGKIILQQLTKEVFLKNIVEARKAQCDGVQHFDFNKSRCKVLTKNDMISENSKGVLYWMTREHRVQDNWSMIFAQRLALKQKVPLYVCFLIKDAHNLYPTNRHMKFLIEGLKLVKKQCDELNIHFHVLNSSPKDLAKLVADNNIGGVVCDFYPIRYPKKLIETFLEHLPKNVSLVQVDAHNIVPAWLASDKQENMAKFIRSKINNKLPQYLTGFPNISEHEYQGNLKVSNEIKNFDDALKFYTPQWDVPEVQWGDGPGEAAALNMLLDFMVNKLKFYGVSSNDPSKDHTSKLSPWLRFGQLSAQRVALEVKSIESLMKERCDIYLEEVIVRRELTDNYCLYNKNYDNINGAMNWARESLKLHAKDKRPWTYTREQLEKGQTHDVMWNAAQIQAVRDGKMHNYMRMYWCKKILEWTESPEQAIEYALWLNDIFNLDGTDPNGYVGVMWSICGVHDQGWRERDVFGKIRYMVDYSLKKKYDMDTYCERFGFKILEDFKKSTGKGRTKGIKRKAN